MDISILVLGAQGAGKTVYLAGLYQQLSIANIDNVVTLETRERYARRLFNTYLHLLDVSREFPPPTPWGVESVSFNCVLTNRHGSFPLFKATYHDYTGEMLDPRHIPEDEDDEQLQRVNRLIDTADVFIVLIDGLKMLRLLQGDPLMALWLDQYLPFVLRHLAKPGPQGLRPVHFVVTKWDLLDGEFTLEEVREKLLAQHFMPGFLEHRREHDNSPVRLIPVSVTGPFARLSESGVIEKVPGQSISPCNVEVPFVAILPDMIRAALKETRSLELSWDSAREARLAQQAGFLDQSRQLLEGPVGRLVDRIMGQTGLATRTTYAGARAWLEDLIERRRKAVGRELEHLHREHQRKQRDVETREAALELALESFEARLHSFEEKYPASLLIGGGL
ncbi:TRAFAC clade GTPase domain-containing protein [uncultured Thermomonospora sp.]|uniref:TRAFAC clade GTPase domain-containing protein n=1 Tax=uncultured Thermomonospora sp. TaxID=671175 RepID=UPI00259AEDFD|nr:hypothetical protein [uncultured Thermomonospora sp.]